MVILGECLISWKGGDEPQIFYVSFKGNDLSAKPYSFGHPVQKEGKMIFICFIYLRLMSTRHLTHFIPFISQTNSISFIQVFYLVGENTGGSMGQNQDSDSDLAIKHLLQPS